jgi:hypothetical protein
VLTPTPTSNQIELNASSPRGFLINRWIIGRTGSAPTRTTSMLWNGGAPGVVVRPQPDGSLVITAADLVWTVSAAGQVSGVLAGTTVVASGPTIMALATDGSTSQQLTEANDESYGPWTAPLSGWTPTGKPAYTVDPAGLAAAVNISGRYHTTAHASMALRFDSAGGLTVNFTLSWDAGATPIRQLGVVFELPNAMTNLSWDRKGQFSYYPPDAIGRLHAVDVTPQPCPSFFQPCGTGPNNIAPLWKQDANPLGSNDFRSTKANVMQFELCGSKGCFRMVSPHGAHHGRAWLTQGTPTVSMLGATLSNEGGNPFGRGDHILPSLVLDKGSTVSGSVAFVRRLHLLCVGRFQRCVLV